MLTAHDIDRIWFGCGNFGGIGSSPRLRSAGDSEEQALQLLDYAAAPAFAASTPRTPTAAERVR